MAAWHSAQAWLPTDSIPAASVVGREKHPVKILSSGAATTEHRAKPGGRVKTKPHTSKGEAGDDLASSGLRACSAEGGEVAVSAGVNAVDDSGRRRRVCQWTDTGLIGLAETRRAHPWLREEQPVEDVLELAADKQIIFALRIR